MSFSTFLLLVLLGWLAFGVGAALILGRRGHDPYPWALLGAVLGPLVVPLAIQARSAERLDSLRVARGVPGSGPVDVLVGIDGSAAAQRALDVTVALLGPRLGRLELVSVLNFGALNFSTQTTGTQTTGTQTTDTQTTDTQTTGTQFEPATAPASVDFTGPMSEREQREASIALLAATAAQVRAAVGRDPDQTLLTGDPATTLSAYALSRQFDLIAVGSRGSGASNALLGSVAQSLAGGSSAPVLVVPDEQA